MCIRQDRNRLDCNKQYPVRYNAYPNNPNQPIVVNKNRRKLPRYSNEYKYLHVHTLNWMMTPHHTYLTYSTDPSNFECNYKSIHHRHFRRKDHHFDRRCYFVFPHRRYLEEEQFDSFWKTITHVLPRQSSLVNGGGQTQVPLVSLQCPPL